VAAAGSLDAVRECITNAVGQAPDPKPPICDGIAKALAAAPTFDSVKGDKLDLGPVVAAKRTEWATTNEVPGAKHCGVVQTKGGFASSYYCVLAESESDDARAREVFAQVVQQIDLCSRPADWSKFVHQPDRTDRFAKLVTATKWRPPGDQPALGIELNLTTSPESSTVYVLRVNVQELSNTK
jgi:hypothetical protein